MDMIQCDIVEQDSQGQCLDTGTQQSTCVHVCVPGLCWAWESTVGLWGITSEENSTLGKGTWNNDQGNGRKGRDGDQEHPGTSSN